MDPLSITASVLTLMGAAKKTYGVLQFISRADEDANSLCVEVSGLESILHSVQAALKKCGGNPLNLASIDEDLWRRIDITLADCGEALDEMAQLARRIQLRHSTLVPGLVYRARVAKRLQQHTRDIESYRDRVRMSTWNLQTLLQVIDVYVLIYNARPGSDAPSRSLSLASKDSQAMISSQLDLLNRRVQERVNVSICLNRSNSGSDRRFLDNMEDFLRAIRAFHKAASTTAGTIQGHSGHDQGTAGLLGPQGSSTVVSRMPTHKRHEIVALLQRNERPDQVPITSPALQVNDADATISPVDGPQPSAPRLNLTMVFSDGFTKLAHRAIQELDFIGAETFLRRAMEYHRNTGVDDIQHRRLRKQLSLSLFFQGRDKEAKELVLDLAEHYGEGLKTTSQLLFALALSLAHELNFDEARTICEERLCQMRDDETSSSLPKEDIFKLLVTCYRQSRDWMTADAILAEVPDIDEDQSLPSPLEFILGSDDLLHEFLGDEECRTTPKIFADQVQNLPVAKRVTRLQERLDGASVFTTRFASSETDGDSGCEGHLRLDPGPFRRASSHGATQSVQNGSESRHSRGMPTLARLATSLKHLAFQSRPESNFELLKWQRCTPQVQKLTPGRDILSWIQGQADFQEVTPAIDSFPDDAEYPLDISGLNAHGSIVAELEADPIPPSTVEIPQVKSPAQVEASPIPSFVTSSRLHAHPEILIDGGTRHMRASLNWNPLSLAWVWMRESTLNVPLLPFHRDDHSGHGVATRFLSRGVSYAALDSARIEEIGPHELPATAEDSADPRDNRHPANPYSPSSVEHAVNQSLREQLHLMPIFSRFAPTNDSGSSNVRFETLGDENSSIAPTDLSKRADTRQTGLVDVPQCEICQWRPDVSPTLPVKRLRAAVNMKRHVRRNHPSEGPAGREDFKRTELTPVVMRRHPGQFSILYPMAMPVVQQNEEQTTTSRHASIVSKYIYN